MYQRKPCGGVVGILVPGVEQRGDGHLFNGIEDVPSNCQLSIRRHLYRVGVPLPFWGPYRVGYVFAELQRVSKCSFVENNLVKSPASLFQYQRVRVAGVYYCNHRMQKSSKGGNRRVHRSCCSVNG